MAGIVGRSAGPHCFGQVCTVPGMSKIIHYGTWQHSCCLNTPASRAVASKNNLRYHTSRGESVTSRPGEYALEGQSVLHRGKRAIQWLRDGNKLISSARRDPPPFFTREKGNGFE
jgi:glycerol kinase